MDFEVTMPDLSTTGEEITVLKWFVEVGQLVKRGQSLLEVETDKATMDVESVESGVLKAQIAEPGSATAVGDVIAILEVDSKAKTIVDSVTAAFPQASGGMFARNRQAARSEVESPAFSMSSAQRVVARRMQQSKQSIPHFYLRTSVNAEPMLSQRNSSGAEKIAWDAFFVCAMAKALKDFPRMSCRFRDDQLISEASGAVGVAVDIDGELYVIPISDAAAKSPVAVSAEIRTTISKLKAGDAESKRLQPADITITNLGMTNVESFSPIINPPEAAILGVGKVMPQVTVIDGKIAVEQRASLTLAVDHRVVNGKYAAEFLACLVEHIESLRERND